VGVEQSKQASAIRQFRKQMPVVTLQPTIESPIAHPFEGKQARNGDHFTGIESSLGMLLCILHLVIYSAKQMDDKIFDSHEAILLLSG
jgi:hypothetical protein